MATIHDGGKVKGMVAKIEQRTKVSSEKVILDSLDEDTWSLDEELTKLCSVFLNGKTDFFDCDSVFMVLTILSVMAQGRRDGSKFSTVQGDLQ